MRSNPAITSFNAGELSPLLGGRPDLEKWQAGLSRCENLITRVQGALQRRGGTRHVTATKGNTKTWAFPFVFDSGDAFLLIFGDGCIRFMRDRGVLVTGSVTAWSGATAYTVGDLALDAGVTYYCIADHTNQDPPNATYWHALEDDIYEIPTPYALADLTRDDGSFAVRCEQTGDVVYMACKGYPPQKLVRFGNVRWVLSEFDPEGGPFKDRNLDKTVTVYWTGTVTEGATGTLTASDDLFQTGHVGSIFYVEMADGTDVKAWQVRTTTDVNDYRRSDNKYYLCTQVGPVDTSDKPAICGEDKPVHTFGRYWDGTGEEQKGDGSVGSIGAEWEFLHAGYGWVRITGYTSATQVTAEVLSRLPEEVVGSGNATWRWAYGAWSDVEGYPENVCFFRERLTWAREQRLWHSVAGDFENFKAKEIGETLPDSAVSISIQSAQGSPIEWMLPTKSRLFLGTNGGEYTVGQQTNQQPFGPGNTQSDPETGWGGVGVRPVLVGAAPVFVEKLGRRLRALVPDQAGEGYTANDLNKIAGLLPSPAVSIAWQQTPHEAIWVACSNGALRAMTMQLEDGVSGWHRHTLGGAGLVEWVATLPAPDGSREDVWLCVKRTIDEAEVRYIEYLSAEYDDGDDAALCCLSDSSVVYSGASTTTLSGLDHLEGETVNVKVNGAAHPQRVVSGGEITLARAATKATVGLAAPYYGQLMPLETGAQMGTAQGRMKRTHKLTVRLLNSLGGKFGPAIGQTDALEYRTTATVMDQPPPLFTGDKVLTFPSGHDTQGIIAFEGADDFPFCLLALFPEVATHEG